MCAWYSGLGYDHRFINKRMLELENKQLCHEFGLQRPQRLHVIQPGPPFLLLTQEYKKAALITG